MINLLKKLRKVILKNRFLLYFTNRFLNFIFPEFCICCTASGYDICPKCLLRLKETAEKRDACNVCGINLKKQKCVCCKDEGKFYSSVFSLFDFDKDIQSIVHNFKYQGLHSVASKVAQEYSYLVPKEFIEEIDLIVPVPLHFHRRLKRGYNQAEVLARHLVTDNNSFQVIKALRRKRFTVTQTALSKSDREKNLKGAISINKKFESVIKGKTILLVDDVITTGATCNVCSEILIKAGAKDVKLLSLARA